MRFSVLADIHGNSLALEAVLSDMDKLGVSMAVNLGDFFSGPLEAGRTAFLLMERIFPSIRVNHDRYLRTFAAQVANWHSADEACVIGLTKLMGQVLDIVAECFCNLRRTRWITMLD